MKVVRLAILSLTTSLTTVPDFVHDCHCAIVENLNVSSVTKLSRQADVSVKMPTLYIRELARRACKVHEDSSSAHRLQRELEKEAATSMPQVLWLRNGSQVLRRGD
ncbi:hypothetical protein KP509_04G003200 [Ceratopteris richardii]|uniref:Uncharacterized protein n=1 Tax=Ceratopteris richardii TaxID=49495 RepID=A0A8T2UPQ2_CERRI|nr:hypothetical protein KP509_04G003200 [Ceratopteris richardii]